MRSKRKMGYSRKNPNRGLRIYFFENPFGIFHFFTLLLEIPDKTKLNLWIFHKIALDPLEIPRQKKRPLKIPHYFFLVALGNFTSFLIKLGNSTRYSFDTPGNSISSTSPSPLFGFFLE